MFEILTEDRKMKALMRFFKGEEGIAMIEYGLIAGLIGVAIIATFGLLTNAIDDVFGQVINTLSNS